MTAPATCQHQPIHLFEMMARLRIEAGVGALPRLGLRYVTAFHRCRTCAAKQDCCAWLDRRTAANFAPDFCPNAEILFELQSDQTGWNPVAFPTASAEAFHVARN
jgi:hypothetical protein